MREVIKEYDLKEDVTIPKLIGAGFKQINPTEEEPILKCVYSVELLDDIELQIELKPLNGFDYNRDIKVFDTFYGHLFAPFYDEDRSYAFLNDIIKEYNREMDDLSKKGVFKEKEIKQNKKLINKRIEE